MRKINFKMYKHSLFICLTYLLIISNLSACLNNKSDQIIENQITLYSNFDPDRGIDFTREGLVDMKNELAFFDFDKNSIVNSAEADIYLAVNCGTDCFNSIIEINDATSVRIGSTEPGYEGCANALENTDGDLYIDNTPNIYSCILTNSGNIVQLLSIENEARTKSARLIFKYTLWIK